MLKGNFEIWNSFICQDYLWNETQYPHEAKTYMTLLFVTYVFIVFVSDYNNDKLSNFPVYMIISSISHFSTFIRFAS